jgi:hypothetical protein
MSTPNEYPGPEQSGSQPPVGGSGSQPENAPQNPNPGYQAPPPGYQQPSYQAPPPGYQQQPYQQPYQQQPQAPAGDSSFKMPADWPKDMKGVMPANGFAGLFNTGQLPQLLKVSYIIWLVTAGIWLLFTVIGFIFSLIALGAQDNSLFGITIPGSGAAMRAGGVKGIIVSIIALALIAAVLVCIMKLKEGMQWARMALSVIAVLSIVLAFLGGGSGVLGIVATVLMWLPESSAWLNARARGIA